MPNKHKYRTYFKPFSNAKSSVGDCLMAKNVTFSVDVNRAKKKICLAYA